MRNTCNMCNCALRVIHVLRVLRVWRVSRVTYHFYYFYHLYHLYYLITDSFSNSVTTWNQEMLVHLKLPFNKILSTSSISRFRQQIYDSAFFQLCTRSMERERGWNSCSVWSRLGLPTWRFPTQTDHTGQISDICHWLGGIDGVYLTHFFATAVKYLGWRFLFGGTSSSTCC